MTKIMKISVLPILLLFMCTFLFGCASKMEAIKVYDSVLDYCNEDNNIFRVSAIGEEQDKNYKISISIGYADKISSTLENEAFQAKNGHYISDFYLLKGVYEPTLQFSLDFFLKNYKFLQSSTKLIDKESAGAIYNKFTKLQETITSFQNGLDSLNYYNEAFGSSEYADKRGMVYKQLDSFKVKYGALIKDCFELNNKFIEVYYSIYKPTDYRVETESALDGLYVQMLCSEIVSKLSSVGFLVDGVKCNFSNTNKSSFEIENESSVIDHTYIKHLEKVSNSANKLSNPESSISTESFQSLDGNEAMKNMVIVLQNQLDTFNAQYDKFLTALNKVDYKDYVASGKSLEEYVTTLNDSQKSYLYVVEDFLNTIYTSLASQVEEVLNSI